MLVSACERLGALGSAVSLSVWLFGTKALKVIKLLGYRYPLALLGFVWGEKLQDLKRSSSRCIMFWMHSIGRLGMCCIATMMLLYSCYTASQLTGTCHLHFGNGQ